MNTQRELTDNVSKLTQCLIKPMANLAELNVNAVNDWIRTFNSLQRVSQAKKPEDFLALQTELSNISVTEMTKYTQEAVRIGLEAISEANEVLTDIVRNSSDKASELMRETGIKASDVMREAVERHK